ncbi:MAG: hypothetical protein LBR11_00365 [Deltaproteobacteria bacterium]|jgi:hypothetical protein|nr:hypothetical protein [Deltaproteobacteria bacterium]
MRLAALWVLVVVLGLGALWPTPSAAAQNQASSLPGDPFAANADQAGSALPAAPLTPDLAAPASLPGDPLASPVAPSPAESDSYFDLSGGGYLESRNRLGTHGQGPVALTQEAFLEMTAKRAAWSLYGSLKGTFEGAAHYWPGQRQAGRAALHELFLTFDSPTLDFWLGRKTHHWGTSDGYNPLDLINPLDPRDPIASGRLLNRVPQWQIGALVTLGWFNLEAIALPRTGVMVPPEPGSPWVPGSYRELRQARAQGWLALERRPVPARWLKDGEYGLRLSTVLAGWDLSLMAYRGYWDEPLFRMSLGPSGFQAVGDYARFRAYGLAWAKGLGAGTFRGEVAVKPDCPIQSPRDWERARLTQVALGWDRDFEGRFYLNLQGFAEFQTQTAFTPREDRQGLTYEARAQWALAAWAAGARGQAYLTGEGALTEIFLEWSYNDHWKFSGGTLIFSGSKEGALGQYGANDCLYLTARFSF